ncbi:putative choline kinase 2 [Wolffia australiana]
MVEAGRGEALEIFSRIPQEAKDILHDLASRWRDVEDHAAMEVVFLTGAMTNEVYQISWPSRGHVASHRAVLLRIYGADFFFDREDEIRTFEFMSHCGHGPRLLGRFDKGRVEEFIHARTLSAHDLREPETSALIAANLREFHDLDVPGPRNIFIWTRLRRWLKLAKDFASPEESADFCLDQMEDEISRLEMELIGGDQRLGFCHNDLQYGNIMIDDVTRTLTIIDYEYSSYNPIAFDLANHFCEMAADYHTETPHVLDFTRYPDPDERRRFAEAYFSSGKEVYGVDLEKLLVDVEKYALASHLLWGLWGIVSKHVNNINFDYGEYARQRFEQYWTRKPIVLGP